MWFVTFTMAALLLGAGLAKARHLVPFAALLRELGLRRGAAIAAVAVVVLEIAVALAIVFQPASLFAAGGVVALATSFAIAGLIALRRPGTLRCHCFGPYGETTLGRNQLIAFPFWIAGAALLRSQQPLPPAWCAVMFALIGLTLAALRAPAAIREARRALDLDIGEVAGTAPSTHGLSPALDSAASAIVLFLSDRCGTCHALAADFRNEGLPSGLWLVLEARTPRSAEEFLAAYGFTEANTGGRLLVDPAGKIAESMGLRTSAVGFHVRDGRITSATTIPSRRYLSSVLPNVLLRRRAV